MIEKKFLKLKLRPGKSERELLIKYDDISNPMVWLLFKEVLEIEMQKWQDVQNYRKRVKR